MSTKPEIDAQARQVILSDPEVILRDRDLMRALSTANAPGLGDNVVDIRGIAIERLESRLSRLEDTHRSVIAAAYENLAGTNLIQRAVVALLEPADFESFLTALNGEVAEIMRVNSIRLVLETVQTEDRSLLHDRFGAVLATRPPGFVDDYTAARGQVRRVLLRQMRPLNDALYGEDADWVQSEACLRLELGQGRLPGMLTLASEDPHQFKQGQGTDLLSFFADVFERVMRRWLN
ncbi:MAG: DUF484 family protein [Pseudomonadota bacterium]